MSQLRTAASTARASTVHRGVLAALVGALLVACGGGDGRGATTPPPPVTFSLRIESGNGQSVEAGLTLPQQIVVVLTGSNSVARSGATVSATASSGQVAISPSTTDVDGRVRMSWTLGSVVGQQTLTIGSPDATASIAAQATATRPRVSQVSINLAQLQYAVGQSAIAQARITSAGGQVLTDRTTNWTSSNQSVATVAPTGQVTAVGPGAATIMATCEGVVSTVPITVTSPVSAVTLAVRNDSLRVGWSRQLAWTVTAGSGVSTAVTFQSASAAVATVTPSGVVTAAAPGQVAVTVTSISDQTKSDTYMLTVVGTGVCDLRVDVGVFFASLGTCSSGTDRLRYVLPADAWVVQEGIVSGNGSFAACVAILAPTAWVEGNTKSFPVYTRNCGLSVGAIAYAHAGTNYFLVGGQQNFQVIPPVTTFSYTNARISTQPAMPICTSFTSAYGVSYSLPVSAACPVYTARFPARSGGLSVTASSSAFAVSLDLVDGITGMVVQTSVASGPGATAQVSRSVLSSASYQVVVKSSVVGASGSVSVTVNP